MARGRAGRHRRSRARAALAAMFCALVLHTMAYAAFLEDPFTWVILALGLAFAPSAQLVVARRSLASRATGARARLADAANARLPRAAGADRRRVHGLERHLEAVRGRVAADLHAAPDAGGLRRRGGAAGIRRRGQHLAAPGHHRGAAALLLHVGGAGSAATRSVATASVVPARDDHGGRADRLPFAGAAVRGAAGPQRAGVDADRDRRPVGVHQLRAVDGAVPARRARRRVLHREHRERAADDRAHAVARRRPGRGRARTSARELRRVGGGAGGALLAAAASGCGRRGTPAALRPMLRFGLPTMPAELSLYALNFMDRVDAGAGRPGWRPPASTRWRSSSARW